MKTSYEVRKEEQDLTDYFPLPQPSGTRVRALDHTHGESAAVKNHFLIFVEMIYSQKKGKKLDLAAGRNGTEFRNM